MSLYTLSLVVIFLLSLILITKRITKPKKVKKPIPPPMAVRNNRKTK